MWRLLLNYMASEARADALKLRLEGRSTPRDKWAFACAPLQPAKALGVGIPTKPCVLFEFVVGG
jgi:hypothetical protein